MPHQKTLNSLFQPSAIAVIGASRTPGKAGYEMLKALGSFAGPVAAVNLGANEAILGRPVHPSIEDVPFNVDLAIITLPAGLCIDAIRHCANKNVKSVMIISGGFGETGADGIALQDQMLEICDAEGMRLLGPNTSGFATPSIDLVANFAPGMDRIGHGPIGVVSQSGAVTLAIASQLEDRGLGASLVVGTGNGQNVSPADIIDHLGNDDKTKVIVAYLEGVSDGRKLFEAVAKTAPKKPVIVYTVGKADIGAFAASHTGNLIGSFDLKASALEQAGALLVQSVEELIDAAAVFTTFRMKPTPTPGIALLTGQAGPGMIISDYLCANEIDMPKLSQKTIDAIAQLLPPMTFQQNPVDTGRPNENFGEVLELVRADPSIDLTAVFALHEPAAIDPVSTLRQATSPSKAPIIFGTAGASLETTKTLTALNTCAIPALPSPDRLARCLRVIVQDAARQTRPQTQHFEHNRTNTRSKVSGVMSEHAAKQMIGTYGIPAPTSHICHTHEEALYAFDRIAKPVALKVVAADILHKTDVGGVHLGIGTKGALQEALHQIDEIKTGSTRAYLIEEMAPPGLDLILGGKRDASFGPSVLIGLGGIFAEALNDVAIRLAPLSTVDATEMIDELRSKQIFAGWRGSPAVSKNQIADAIVSLAHILNDHPEIQEIDINPLRLYPDRVIALDAVIVAD